YDLLLLCCVAYRFRPCHLLPSSSFFFLAAATHHVHHALHELGPELDSLAVVDVLVLLLLRRDECDCVLERGCGLLEVIEPPLPHVLHVIIHLLQSSENLCY